MGVMYRQLLRIAWRILTALLVLSLAWITSFVLFPFFDRRMPIFPSAVIAYLVLAYIFLPFVSRFWRLVFQPNHIPLYAVTGDGWPADPVNIAIIAKNKRQLTRAMEAAGWRTADKRTLKNKIRLFLAFAFDRDYPTAPFTSLYLFGRTFDIGFQKPRGHSASPRTRHHVRFWRLDVIDTKTKYQEHFHFWKQLLRNITKRNKSVWIGAAIDDNKPVGVHWRNLQFTHGNDSDTNKERDLIVSDLKAAGVVKKSETMQAGEPFRFYGQIIGNQFICDGQIEIVTVKS